MNYPNKDETIFAFGGPSKWQEDNLKKRELIDQIILDENYLHSCFDYKGHLDFLRNAALRNKSKLKIIVKCYLNYPSILSIRRESIYKQIKRIRDFLKDIDTELVIQISSISPQNNLNIQLIKKFLKIIHSEFQIKIIIFETFPASEKIIINLLRKFIKAINLLKYEKKISLGLTSYESTKVSGFTELMRKFIKSNNILFAPMRVIGSKSKNNEIISSKNKLKKELRYKGFFRAITQVSTIEQYLDLKSFSFEILQQVGKKENIDKIYENFNASRISSTNPYGILYEFNPYKYLIFMRIRLKEIYMLIKQILKGKRPLKDLNLILPKSLV